MRDKVTMQRRLSLAKPIPRKISGPGTLSHEIWWDCDQSLNQGFSLTSLSAVGHVSKPAFTWLYERRHTMWSPLFWGKLAVYCPLKLTCWHQIQRIVVCWPWQYILLFSYFCIYLSSSHERNLNHIYFRMVGRIVLNRKYFCQRNWS